MDMNKSKALERISELFLQAKDSNNSVLSKRYVNLARRIAMRYRVRFSREQKLSFCKNCDAFLVRGKNSSIRLIKSNIVLSCKECGFVRRFRYRK